MNLGYAPQDEAFPAELGKLKSLRVLDLSHCGLRTVPSFVGGLQSLERLALFDNDEQICGATLDILIEGCPCLRQVRLSDRYSSWTPESRAHLEAFKARLLAKNPNAKVLSESVALSSPFPCLFCFLCRQCAARENAGREGRVFRCAFGV